MVFRAKIVYVVMISEGEGEETHFPDMVFADSCKAEEYADMQNDIARPIYRKYYVKIARMFND